MYLNASVVRWSAIGLLMLGGLGSSAALGQSFDSRVRGVLADKALAKASVGVAIARVSQSSALEFVFKSNADAPLIPASNLKVITTSSALATLGGDFRFRTKLIYLDGDLYLVGDGDPTLGDPEIGWTYDQVFKSWADDLKKKGITSVKSVYVDDSIFDKEFAHPNWPSNQLDLKYVAQVAGLTFRTNTIEIHARSAAGGVEISTVPPTGYVSITDKVKVGSKNAIGAIRTSGSNEMTVQGEIPRSGTGSFEVTVNDPALYGATVLAETLKREGITIAKPVDRRELAKGAGQIVGLLETPLSVVLGRCNKDSMNLYAESLAKRLAAKATGKPGSWDGARETTGAWLKKLGVGANEFVLDDGCGLSRHNRISAQAMVRVLAADFASPARDEYLSSLAVGGTDGTLERRFSGTLRGRVHAKTGFINGVSTLSGFLQAKNGQWYAFSILMNSVSGVKPLQEKIVQAIDEQLP